MSDSTKTYAVVVGVEKYAAGSAWDLDGPASDACRFVQWLRRRGVPVNQISLFLSALDGNNGLTNQLDVAALAATQDVVKTALTETLTKKRGDLLYFFWGGHGVVDAQGNRRLFYADATENNLRHLNLNNLLAAWRTAVLSGFPQQIGFIDACANYIEHMRRAVSMPEETYPASVPVAGVEQFVLLAAAPGELARNQTAKKSGAFSEALLAQLEQSSNGWPPDLQQITQRLQEHFAALRDAGEARQTPAHFWFRDWNGSEGTLGSLVRQPQPTAGGGEELGFVQRGKLTNALLACEVMSNTQTRESVISDLRREIKFNTWRNPASSIDVGNLVRTAMHYSGGLAELLTVVRFYEQGSLAAQELDRVVAMPLAGNWLRELKPRLLARTHFETTVLWLRSLVIRHRSTAMAIQYHLNANHQMKLAEALLRFESMQTPASRDSVVADLPREVKENVRRSNAAREDVLSILHTCLSYTDALEQLLVRVKFGQETSIYLQQLIEVELEVLPPLPLSEELLVELRQALSVSPVSDDLIRLFHGSLPAGAVSPRDPRTAYEVLRLLQFAPAGGLGFVERLAETAVDPGRARLRAWVRQATPKLSVEPGQLQAMRQQIAEAVNIPSYLLIQFTPTAPQAETFTVQGWLWRNDGDCRTLSYDDQPHRPVEFEAIVEQFVCEVERETVDLTIELIVPRHLFGQDFTQWRLQIGDMRASLIAQHPIVLRWQERLAEPRLRNRWQQKWQSLKGSDADGSALLFWLARADVNASHLLARLQSADSGLCVALGFTPPTALDQSSDDPLKVVLIMGTPIAIWFREGSNIDEQMIKDQLTNRRPSELPRRVFELRNQAVQQEDAQHIGYQVTLLYDDGDRVPQLLNAGAPRVGGG